MRSSNSQCWWKGKANSKRSHSVEGICIDFRGNEGKDKVRHPETNVGEQPIKPGFETIEAFNRRTS